MSAYVRFLHLDNKKTRLVVQSMNDRHTLNGSSNFIIKNFMKFYRSPDSNRVDGNVFITLNTFNMFMADYRDKVRKEKYNKDHDISTPVEILNSMPCLIIARMKKSRFRMLTAVQVQEGYICIIASLIFPKNILIN